MMNNELLRHLLSTINYRFQTVVSGHSKTFGDFELGKGSRKPLEIIHHMSQVIEWSSSMISEVDYNRNQIAIQGLEEEMNRFLSALMALDKILLNQAISVDTSKKLIQGPLSDVLTHIGQIAMLSRLDDHPVQGKDYSKAAIKTLQ